MQRNKKPISKKINTKSKLKNIKNPKLLLAGLLIVAIASFGTWRVFFAGAAPWNCQKENGIDICDIDQTAGNDDTVLSVDGEPQVLASQGWGIYYGAAFRAPRQSYNGALPVTRILNATHSWHDWVTDPQLNFKQANYGANSTLINEGIAFFAWPDGRQPGTVPVYRITRGGPHSQSMFTTDKAWVDRTIAADAGNPNGWRFGGTMPEVAFYAFPPNYMVAGQANPYDCSILENFVSDRCTYQRQQLESHTSQGNIPKDNECPKTADAYLRVPFPGQLSADCQKFWNTYIQDCTIPANLETDRCAAERQKRAQQQQEQIRNRTNANNNGNKASSGGSGSSNVGGSSGGGQKRPEQKNGSSAGDKVRAIQGPKISGGGAGDKVASSQEGQSKRPGPKTSGGSASSNVSNIANTKRTCTISWKITQSWLLGGAKRGEKIIKGTTLSECQSIYWKASFTTSDSFGRKYSDYKYRWE
jgi:uncharacterized membrane protein YgcG